MTSPIQLQSPSNSSIRHQLQPHAPPNSKPPLNLGEQSSAILCYTLIHGYTVRLCAGGVRVAHLYMSCYAILGNRTKLDRNWADVNPSQRTGLLQSRPETFLTSSRTFRVRVGIGGGAWIRMRRVRRGASFRCCAECSTRYAITHSW